MPQLEKAAGALELGPGIGPGTFPYETLQGRVGFLRERLLLRVLGNRAFASTSIVSRVVQAEGLAGEAEFLDRYRASKDGIQELWGASPRELPQQVEAFYDEHDADLWRQAYRSRWSRSYKAKLLLQARIMDRLARGDRSARLLDYGCGAGVLAQRLLELGYQELHLADVPSATLRFCRDSFGERIRGYHEVGAGRSLEGAWDVISCFDCLEHTVDPLRIARELVEALAPGGGLALSYPLETDFGFSHTRAAAEARPAVMAFLADELQEILPQRVYRKGKPSDPA